MQNGQCRMGNEEALKKTLSAIELPDWVIFDVFS